MPTSTFFNNYKRSTEQELLEDLVVESIRIYGQDMYYIVKDTSDIDPLYLQSETGGTFTSAHLIEMYIKSVMGFEGDGSLMSIFGPEIRDRVTFTVAARAFANEVGELPTTDVKGNIINVPRPREGDLIYFPLNDKCFQIKFVENKPFFYQLGSLPMYDLYCELFEYSGETFDTGVPEVDIIQEILSNNILDYGIIDEFGNVMIDEFGNIITDDSYELVDPTADNDILQEEGGDWIDWSEMDPFSESTPTDHY